MLGVMRGGRLISRASYRAISSLSLPAKSSPVLRSRSIRPLSPSLASVRSFHAARWQLQEAAPREEEVGEDSELTMFQELADNGLVHRTVIDTITRRMNITTMTDVQRLTINETLDGTDVIAQAKTGTGKTLAFLIPIIQRVLGDKSLSGRSYSHAPVDIRALIISPTRELAEQIAVEARKVTSSTNVRVQTAVGGTGKSYALQRMRREGCHILVGTPGRVKDLLSDPHSGVDLKNIEAFVLDEADRLLDIGFAPEIAHIQSYMPRREERDRQTLMFSATVPRGVVGLVRETLKPDFKFVRTTDPHEQPTHERVPQKVVFVKGLENRLPALLELAHKKIEEHKKNPETTMPFKAIVYFPSTADVTVSADIFQNLRGSFDGASRSNFTHPLEPAEIIQMHSRLTQNERTRNSARFRNAKSAILFSSDVTARGMDFPNVSHVIQIGLPRNDDDYIHRLGRTGRAGNSGEGWLLVQERQMRDFRRGLGAELPIDRDTSLETATLDMSKPAAVSETASHVLRNLQAAVKGTPFMQKSQAYLSMFGVIRQDKYKDPQELVDDINSLARYGWGLEELPVVSPDFAQKMGLARTRGLNIKGFSSSSDRPSSRGRPNNDDFDINDPFGQSSSHGRSFGREDDFPPRSRGFQRGFDGPRREKSYPRRY